MKNNKVFKFLTKRPLMVLGMFLLVGGNIMCYEMNDRILSVSTMVVISLITIMGAKANK